MNQLINFVFFVLGWILLMVGISLIPWYWSVSLGLSTGGLIAMALVAIDHFIGSKKAGN